ncbi:hypothetical protein HZA98_04465 [Candidatus Woesearchaeota archaeon]|nr:hypothetical protein [Candidatus Woesearchaeota archaeon]
MKELQFTPLKEEEHYHAWRSSLDQKKRFSVINGLVRRVGKGYAQIRQEILYAEQHGTLEDSESRIQEQLTSQLSLDLGINIYFASWYAHDKFAYDTAEDITEIVEEKSRIGETAKRFLDNDRGIRVYVSNNLPQILQKLGTNLEDLTGREIIPPIDSFELFLITEAKERTVEEFAERYSYGDFTMAEQEQKRLYNPKQEALLERIRKNREDTRKKFSTEIERLCSKKADLETRTLLHRFLRLSHWAGFEEPRKRYSIEGGIVDYLFRELVFQTYKESIPELKVYHFCLEINQKEFFRLIGG